MRIVIYAIACILAFVSVFFVNIPFELLTSIVAFNILSALMAWSAMINGTASDTENIKFQVVCWTATSFIWLAQFIPILTK